MHIRIRRARISASMTQADLAHRLGVSRSAVTQWERSNGTLPSVEHLSHVACETGVGFEWLATGRGTMRPDEIALDAAVLTHDFAADEQESRALTGMKRLSGRKKKVAASIIELLAQM